MTVGFSLLFPLFELPVNHGDLYSPLLWDLQGAPWCSAVPPGDIQGDLPNLWALIHKEASEMRSANVVSRIIGSWNIMIMQEGNFALQSYLRVWKQHNPQVISGSKTFPEV